MIRYLLTGVCLLGAMPLKAAAFDVQPVDFPIPRPLPFRLFDFRPVDFIVQRALEAFDTPGAAVAIVKDGRVIYLKGFGIREKGKQEPVTPDTIFPIASCTKAFTATALAMLVDDGKLNWDDKVRDHLDYFRLSDELADRDVTIRDLLCHRTGMPRHDYLWSALTSDTKELIRRWGRGRPASSFRSRWEYANVPFTAAGVIVGKLNNTDWAGAIKSRIFEPLGMSRSSCTWKEGFTADDHAAGHYYGLDKTITPVKWDEIDHTGGAGSINSTARDMAAWLQFQLNGGKYDRRQLISARSLAETRTAQMLVKVEGPLMGFFPPIATRFTHYGLGWFVHDYRGFNCVSHAGTLTGFRSQCIFVPERNLGIFVVCNLRPSYVPEAVTKCLLDLFLGLSVEDWISFYKTYRVAWDANIVAERKKRDANRKPDTQPSLPLRSYVGTYTEPAYDRAEVVFENGHLMIRWGKLEFRLEHHHYDTFTAIPVAPPDEILALDRATFEVLFRLGTDGEVETMKFLEQDFRRAKK